MRYRVFLAVGLLLLLAASPATAKPLQSGHYTYSDPAVPGECGDGSLGSGYVRVSSGHGAFMIKDATPATGGQFFYFQNKYWWQDVFTNPDTGQWAVARGNGILKESRAVAVGGGVFTYHDIEAGQPFMIEDMSGRVVVRDRGLIDILYTFDTLNDSTPGGNPLDNGTLVRVAGPHPGFSDTFDFCGVLAGLIGAP